MARKIPKDASFAEWSANRYVDANPDFSLIKSGYLITPLFLPISKDRRACLQNHKLYADWKYGELFASLQLHRDLSGLRVKIEDAVVLTAPANHWHFNLDGLANLSEAVLSRCNRIFIDQECSADQVAFLGAYAKTLCRDTVRVETLADPIYALRNVHVPTNKPFPSKVAAYRECLGRIKGIRRHSDAHERLYISRRGAATRQLVNEDELLSMLQSDFGFHRILNEDHEIIDQVSIYRYADVIMGPHGAGLTNMLFCENASLIVEMFNSVQQPFYPALSQALGVRYLGIPGTPASTVSGAHRSDNAPFRVDVAGIRAALGKLLT